MDRKYLIEQKKNNLYFKNLMVSMNAITTIEIYEAGEERDIYKQIISSYYELWKKNEIRPNSKLACTANENQCIKWIIDKAELTSKEAYIFIKNGYYEGYAKIILNDLSESILQLLHHEEKVNDLHGSVKCGFSKGFLLNRPIR
jgi:hypothetical protein